MEFIEVYRAASVVPRACTALGAGAAAVSVCTPLMTVINADSRSRPVISM